jgi:hypothetical protein
MRFTDAERAEWIRSTVAYARAWKLDAQLKAALKREAAIPHKQTGS